MMQVYMDFGVTLNHNHSLENSLLLVDHAQVRLYSHCTWWHNNEAASR